MDELYGAAVDVLLAIVAEPQSDILPIEGARSYRLPHDDTEALLIEAALLVDWFWPAVHGKPAPDSVREEFVDLWRPLLKQAASEDQTIILRDYHSPNLMWLKEREGLRKVGILDFQDGLIDAPPRPSVALQDARSTCRKRLKPASGSATVKAQKQFQATDSSALCHAWRSKILGIFARWRK
jgi:aminoglycoside/choline kinase family phosphotransferase